MLGMTSGSSSQGSRSQLFPTMPHDEQARDRQRAEYMSWSDTSSSPFSSMHGGERRHQHQRQSEAPTLLVFIYLCGLSLQIRQLYGIKMKSKAAISLTFDSHCKLIAALLFILYSRLI